jgi:uncharacterized protein (DUF1330 family)
MPAYVVGLHQITDPARFEAYRTIIGELVAKFGGRYLTRGENLSMPEGGYWTPERVVVIEFPDRAAIDAWYASPEYQPLIELRKACQSANDMTLFMDGISTS